MSDLDDLQSRIDEAARIRSPFDRGIACEGIVLSGDIDDLIAETRRLRAFVAEIETMHQPDDGDGDPDWVWCLSDDNDFPCETRRALDRAKPFNH